MHISPAAMADVPQLNVLVNSAYRGAGSRQGWTTEADLLDGIRIDEATLKQYLAEAGSTILACRNDEQELTGCVYLKQSQDNLYLGMLTVSPRLQGQGIGKLLLHEAEKEAAELNCKKIVMTVISIRHELIEWYTKHGYKDSGLRQPFPTGEQFGIPKVPLEFMVMERYISNGL